MRRRIVVVDGPAVLGWEVWREIDEHYAYGATVGAVTAGIEAGELPRVAPEPLARVLLGMITQAGLEVGRSDDPGRRREELGAAIGVVLDRLLVT